MEITLDRESADKLRKVALSAYSRLLKLKDDYNHEFRHEFSRPAEKIIDEWYGSYEPRMYKRNGDDGLGGLYSAFHLNTKVFPPSLEYGYELMEGYYHQGAKFVYVNSFEKGWHGGSFGKSDDFGISPDKDSPQWRKYNPKVAKEMEETPYEHWYGITAPRSDPPGPRILDLYDKVFYSVDNKYGKKAEEIIRVFIRDVRSIIKAKGGS